MSVKLIPKHLTGGQGKRIMPWNTLNYKKWGLKEYNDPEFSASFGKARRGGEKEFVWKDNRYTTKTLDKQHEADYTNGISWIQNYYKNLPEENITPTRSDSLDAYFKVGDLPEHLQARAKYDSIANIVEKDPDWDKPNRYRNPKFDAYFEAQEKSNDMWDKNDAYKNRVRDSLYTRLPADIKLGLVERSLKLGTGQGPRLVPTQQPKLYDITAGYWDQGNNKIYANIEDETPEHEYNHYIVNERKHNLMPKRQGLYTNGGHGNGYIDYVTEPTEVASRNIEVKRMLSKKHPNISPYLKIDEPTYNKIKGDIGREKGRDILYSRWETFNDNYNNDLVK